METKTFSTTTQTAIIWIKTASLLEKSAGKVFPSQWTTHKNGQGFTSEREKVVQRKHKEK